MFKRQFYVYQAEAGDEGSTGGEMSVEDKIKAAVKEATDGLLAKNKELLGEVKTGREALKKFEGIDVEEVKSIMAKFDGDEDAKLVKEGKIQELLDRKYAKRDQEWQRKLDAAFAERDTAKAKADKFLDSVLDDRLRSAFNGKIDPRSMKAALLEAKQIFKLDDEGRAIQVDSDGQIVVGKDGKSPFSPLEWVESDATRKESPYLFPATGSGTGSSQGTNQGAAGKTAELMKLSPTERMAAARETT